MVKPQEQVTPRGEGADSPGRRAAWERPGIADTRAFPKTARKWHEAAKGINGDAVIPFLKQTFAEAAEASAQSWGALSQEPHLSPRRHADAAAERRAGEGGR